MDLYKKEEIEAWIKLLYSTFQLKPRQKSIHSNIQTIHDVLNLQNNADQITKLSANQVKKLRKKINGSKKRLPEYKWDNGLKKRDIVIERIPKLKEGLETEELLKKMLKIGN